MVEPLSIASTAAGLAVTITRVIVDVDKFRIAVRDAHDEMISINSELTSLKYILDTAATDIKAPGIKVPLGFEAILGQCGTCLNQLNASLKTYDTMRLKDRVRFVWSGKDKILGYRDVLAAHKSHLILAIGWMTSNLAHGIKSDTTQIKVNTTEIMAETAELRAGQNHIRLVLERIQSLHESAWQSANPSSWNNMGTSPDAIFAKIDTLTAKLPDSLKAQVQESNDRLQRYFDSLTTDFAPTVIDESDFWRETEGTVRGFDEDEALANGLSKLQSIDLTETLDDTSGSLLTDKPIELSSLQVPKATKNLPETQEAPIMVEFSNNRIDHELIGIETLAMKAWRQKMVEAIKSEPEIGPRNGKTYVPTIDYHLYPSNRSDLTFELILRRDASEATFCAWVRTWAMSGNAMDVTFIWSPNRQAKYDRRYLHYSPLELALKCRDEILLEHVLESKIVIKTGLHLALSWNVSTARKLVQAGLPAPVNLSWLAEFEVEAVKNHAAHGLSLQQAQDHVRYVLTFLFEAGYSLERDKNQLARAALAGAATIVTFLLEKGAPPDGDDDPKFTGNPPLYSAIGGKHGHIIKLLFDAGANCLDRRPVKIPSLNQKHEFRADVSPVEFAAHLDSCARYNMQNRYQGATILRTHTDHLEILNHACGTNYKAKSSKRLGLEFGSLFVG